MPRGSWLGRFFFWLGVRAAVAIPLLRHCIRENLLTLLSRKLACYCSWSSISFRNVLGVVFQLRCSNCSRSPAKSGVFQCYVARVAVPNWMIQTCLEKVANRGATCGKNLWFQSGCFKLRGESSCTRLVA